MSRTRQPDPSLSKLHKNRHTNPHPRMVLFLSCFYLCTYLSGTCCELAVFPILSLPHLLSRSACSSVLIFSAPLSTSRPAVHTASKLTGILGCVRRGSGPISDSEGEASTPPATLSAPSPPQTPVLPMQSKYSNCCTIQEVVRTNHRSPMP